MSDLYPYICVRTTVDPFIPRKVFSVEILASDVSDAFSALSGGRLMVGEIKLFPLQRSVPSHLLCDGRELSKASFPELYSYLGDTQGTPADPNNFVLPNFIGAAALAPAATANAETVSDGTVTSPPPSDPSIPGWYDQYGDVDSGGRTREVPYFEP